MAKKGGKLKTIVLTLVLLALIAVVFILMGGGSMLKSAGKWISGVGKEADVVKQKVEEKASNTGKAVEKVMDTVKSRDKTGDKK
jgi:membrane protein required for beta-lactamase induction